MITVKNFSNTHNKGSFSNIRKTKTGHFQVADAYMSEDYYNEDKWEVCRDVFQTCGTLKFLFKHSVGKGSNIARLVWGVEDLLGIPRTYFDTTQCNSVMFVKASPWWYKTLLRKSFFTMMLRAGEFYKINGKPTKEGMIAALCKQKYGKKTEHAIRRFLDGHIKSYSKITDDDFEEYNLGYGCNKGWYDTFGKLDESEVSEILR